MNNVIKLLSKPVAANFKPSKMFLKLAAKKIKEEI